MSFTLNTPASVRLTSQQPSSSLATTGPGRAKYDRFSAVTPAETAPGGAARYGQIPSSADLSSNRLPQARQDSLAQTLAVFVSEGPGGVS